MPLSIFERLKIGEIKPTGMTLQLADHSVTYPTGIVEDVLVKIDKFVFSVDFVVLEMEEDVKVPLILGRPFLATVRAVVDVSSGKLTLKLGEEELTFDTRKVMRHPSEEEECHVIALIDICVEETLQNSFDPSCFHTYDNPLFDCDLNKNNSSICDDRYEEKKHVEKEECEGIGIRHLLRNLLNPISLFFLITHFMIMIHLRIALLNLLMIGTKAKRRKWPL
jgi:hypothetical protein